VIPDTLTTILDLYHRQVHIASLAVLRGNVNASGTICPGGSLSITVNTRVKDQSQGTISNTVYLSSLIDPMKNNKTATDVTSITPAVDLVMNESTTTASHSSSITTPDNHQYRPCRLPILY
jgi:hypothetical protein